MVRGFCIYRINNVTNKSLLRIMNKKQPHPQPLSERRGGVKCTICLLIACESGVIQVA